MRSLEVASLHFSVRPKVVLRYGGQLLFIFALLTAVPFCFALFVGEYSLARIYGMVLAGTGLTGFFLQRLKAPEKLQTNEALAISAAIFIITPLIASTPFYYSGLAASDAIFEAVSAITTTGLTTLPSVENMPKTFLFSRALLQWTGGLGIVVLSIALLLPQSQAALQFLNENWQNDDILTSARIYARGVLKVYLLLSVAGIGMLLMFGVHWLNAVTHILAAVSTGGFSTFDNSLAGLTSWQAQAIIIFFCLLGAVPLGLYFHTTQNKVKRLLTNSELIGLLIAAGIGVLLLSLIFFLVDGQPLNWSFRNGALLALSAQTTAGFSSVPVSELSYGAKLLLILLMSIGGCVGSTAGGIKIMRLLVVLIMFRMLIIRSGLAAGAVIQPRYKGKRLGNEEIFQCLLLVILFIGLIIFSWAPFIVMGYPPLDALFEVVSACGTVGLSSGVTSSTLPALLKVILCFDMLLGRLEIIAFLVLFYPPTWHGKKR